MHDQPPPGLVASATEALAVTEPFAAISPHDINLGDISLLLEMAIAELQQALPHAWIGIYRCFPDGTGLSVELQRSSPLPPPGTSVPTAVVSGATLAEVANAWLENGYRMWTIPMQAPSILLADAPWGAIAIGPLQGIAADEATFLHRAAARLADLVAAVQLRQEILHYGERDRLLNLVQSAIGCALSLNAIFTAAAIGLAKLLHLDRVSFWQWDAQRDLWVIAVTYNRRADRLETETPAAMAAEWPIALALQEARCLSARHIPLSPFPRDPDAPMGTQCVLPLRCGGSLHGLAILQKQPPRYPWAEAELETAASVADELAIAIEQAHLRAHAEAHQRRERLLAKISETIRHSPNLETIFETTVREVAALFDSGCVVLDRHIPEPSATPSPGVPPSMPQPNRWQRAASHGAANWTEIALTEFWADATLNAQLIAGRVVRCNASPDRAAVRGAWLHVPLQIRDWQGLWGVLRIGVPSHLYAWHDADADLAIAIANQLAIAIHQTQLHALTQQQANRAELLNQIVRYGSLSLDAPEIVKRAVEAVRRAFHVSACSLFLCSEDSRFFSYRARAQIVGAVREETRQAAIESFSFAKRVLAETEPVAVTTAAIESAPVLPDREATRALLAVALRWEGRPLGLLAIEQEGDPRPWQAAEGTLLGEVATYLSIAIAHANLRATEREHARTLDVQNRLMAQALQQAQAAAIAKQQFLANVSHELLTPLHGVMGAMQLLAETELTPQQREVLADLQLSGECLLQNIQGILRFTDLDTQQIALDPIDTDLGACLEDVVDDFAATAHQKGLEIVALVDPQLPAIVRVDAVRLKQVLVSLVANAIKFTDRGTVTVRAIGLGQRGDRLLVRFTVADTGCGIAPEESQKLFLPFSQIDSSLTRRHGGTGLGLAICRQLVELMGGSLGVESTPQVGSEFWFNLELLPGTDKVAPNLLEDPLIPASPSWQSLSAIAISPTPEVLEAIRTHGEALGMAIETVADAELAIARLRQGVQREQPYDLALLDARIPLEGGEVLGRAILADPALARTRLVILSDRTESALASRLIRTGFFTHITKPIRRQRLLECFIECFTSSPMPLAPTPSASPAFPPLTIPRVTPTSPCVLVVEDNPVNQRVLVAMLRRLGYETRVAENGREAISAIEQFEIALVLMDLQMPVMDGLEASRILRQREAEGLACGRSRLPILAVTANDIDSIRRACQAAGMDDVLAKPLTKEALATALHRWLGCDPPA